MNSALLEADCTWLSEQSQYNPALQLFLPRYDIMNRIRGEGKTAGFWRYHRREIVIGMPNTVRAS